MTDDTPHTEPDTQPARRSEPVVPNQGKMPSRVPPDVAEAEFERFCDTMDLEVDPETMDDEDRQAFARERATVIRAICAGRLVFDEASAEPIFYPKSSDESLRFREPTGASFQAMEGKKRNAHVTQLYATMADITGTSTKTFAAMPNRDLKVCRAITLLFMG